MKHCYAVLFMLCLSQALFAQTWNGSASTDWNTASNWTPANVPGNASNATIPTSPTGNRWPTLATSISINSLTMAAGAQLNVNGKSITVASMDIRGLLTNTAGGTDIAITMTGNANSYTRSLNVTDDITYTLAGSGIFYDNYTAGTMNTYNGNVIINRTGTGTSYISQYDRNDYKASLSISNAVSGTVYAFKYGSDIAGNLSFNSAGGTLDIGSTSHNTLVQGTINITSSGGSNFSMVRVINQVTGGSIVLNDKVAVDFIEDTLKIANLTCNLITGILHLDNNSIIGNVSYQNAPSNNSTQYVSGNVITGTSNFNIQGTGTFYDTYGANSSNHYSGTVTYTKSGSSSTYIGYYDGNTYGANVIFNNTTGTGIAHMFRLGADISGNLSVTGGTGNYDVGSTTNATNIAGTVNISGTGSGNFNIYWLKNLVTGGNIDLSGRTSINIEKDTLKLSGIAISQHAGALNIEGNDLLGNVVFSNQSSNSSIQYIRRNKFTGTCSFTHNGTSSFYDNYGASNNNQYTGNYSYTSNNTGNTYIGYYDDNIYGGNVTIVNTVPSLLQVFGNNFGSQIAGNLSVSSVGGNLNVGNTNSGTTIQGTLNITANNSGTVNIHRLTNFTNGGSITLDARSDIDMNYDSLLILNLNITAQTNGLDLRDCKFSGNLNYANTGGNAVAHYVRGCYVEGNVTYAINGSGPFYDTYSTNSDNFYLGNYTVTRTGNGTAYLGFYDTVSVGGNIMLNINTPGNLVMNYLSMIGNSQASIVQNGNIPLALARFSIKKTGTGNVTLEDSLKVDDRVYFGGGNIITNNQKELIMLDGCLSLGESDASHVVGPMVKIGNDAFKYPVGSSTHLQAVAMNAPSTTTSRYRCQYFPVNPHPTYDTSQRVGLAAVSGCEYWSLVREVGTSFVILTFDYGGPCLCVEQPANLRVARWDAGGTQWVSEGNGATTGSLEGTIQTGAAVAGYGIFTLGSTATVTPGVTISANVANKVCVCKWVTFTATPVMAGCTQGYSWKKNGIVVGSNATYSDSTLKNGDVVMLELSSGAAFSSPAVVTSNSVNITTTNTNTWTGATSTSWHLASNWSCAALPCGSTSVVVNSGTPNNCEILSGNVRVISLTANPGATVSVFSGASLSIQPSQ